MQPINRQNENFHETAKVIAIQETKARDAIVTAGKESYIAVIKLKEKTVTKFSPIGSNIFYFSS